MPHRLHVPESTDSHVIAQQPGAAVAQPPHVEVELSPTIRDISGITGKGATAETARLISQFGLPTAIIAVFLVIYTGSQYFDRQDRKTEIEKVTATFSKTIADRRDDEKEDRAISREIQGKLWTAIRDLEHTNRESNVILSKTADVTREANLLIAKTAELVAKQIDGMDKKK